MRWVQQFIILSHKKRRETKEWWEKRENHALPLHQTRDPTLLLNKKTEISGGGSRKSSAYSHLRRLKSGSKPVFERTIIMSTIFCNRTYQIHRRCTPWRHISARFSLENLITQQLRKRSLVVPVNASTSTKEWSKNVRQCLYSLVLCFQTISRCRDVPSAS